MAIQAYPLFDHNKGLTIDAIFRAAKMPAAPNLNNLPQKRSFKELQKPAAQQVIKLVKQIRKSRAIRLIKKSKYVVFVQTAQLFPQLGFFPRKDQKLTLHDIFGPYVERVVKALSRLPARYIAFGLSPDDDWCDNVLLHELGMHPKLQRHKTVLYRPIHSSVLLQLMQQDKKNKKRNKPLTKRSAAIVQCTHTDFRAYKLKKKHYLDLRRMSVNGSYMLFD